MQRRKMQNVKNISQKKKTVFRNHGTIKMSFAIRRIERKSKTEFKRRISQGGGLSLCFYPQEQTQNGFMIIFGKNQKSDLSRGV